MAGTGIQIAVDSSQLQALRRRLDLLSLNLSDRRDLLDAFGAEVESQTRRRISEEKTSPAGDAWAEWSGAYGARRHGGHSLLQGDGDLLDSIAYEAGEDEAEVGANLIYGAIHQFGGEPVGIPIPERPWLGLSEDNIRDLEGILDDWMAQAVTA